jgi:hypothetical protein
VTRIVVWRGETGEIEGFSDKDKRAYNRLKKKLQNLALGEMFEIDCWFPRNSDLHKLHMKMESEVYAAQDQFSNFEHFRTWLKIGAGACEWAPGHDGTLIPIPHSISFRTMDDEELRVFHEQVKAFLFTEHALAFLWPHLSDEQRFDMMDTLLHRF